MTRYLLPYATVVVVMVLLDVIWLGGVMRSSYQNGIGHLMAENPNFAAAALFYLLFAIGVMAFVVLRTDSWQTALGWGALFGAMTYLTYDLTNMATLKDWPIGLSIIDTAWGCFATGVASVAARYVSNRFA